MENDRKERKNSKIWLTLFIVFLVVLAIGIVILARQYFIKKSSDDTYEDMQNVVNSAEEEDTEEEEDILAKLGITIPQKNLDWDALHEENEDIYAWIYVPDATVDYPVLQHPSDNSFYLNHTIDGAEGIQGCIYTEDYNKKDFTDSHTVIYGHNLKDQTMFSSLHNFEDEKLVEENHFIFIYTEEDVYVYEIFAAYEFPAIHLLDNYELDNEYVYEQYIRDVLNMDTTNARVANIRHDIEVTKEDRILTLSTCTSDHDSSLRFLVVGVLLNP